VRFCVEEAAQTKVCATKPRTAGEDCAPSPINAGNKLEHSVVGRFQRDQEGRARTMKSARNATAGRAGGFERQSRAAPRPLAHINKFSTKTGW